MTSLASLQFAVCLSLSSSVPLPHQELAHLFQGHHLRGDQESQYHHVHQDSVAFLAKTECLAGFKDAIKVIWISIFTHDIISTAILSHQGLLKPVFL